MPILVLGAALGRGLHAADWPMWRCDAQRSGFTANALPGELHLQYVLQLPRPKPAWPADQTKLQFDRSYEPIVVGQLLIVPSMVQDSVTAYDTRTGQQRWRFYADGPVRLAPCAWNDRVYFVSDDGHLYCLKAGDGALQWKVRGGPTNQKILGNERLVSMWPARGAPVVDDGVVYFAAGVWPFMGIFIHAVDAQTGEILWTNSGSGSNYLVQPHNSPAFAGVSPQGYLAVAGERLIVSGGRTVPAVYHRRTGEFLYYQPGSRDLGKDPGGFGVSICGDWMLNGGGFYEVARGIPLGSVAADCILPGGRLAGIQRSRLVINHLPPLPRAKDAKSNSPVRFSRERTYDLPDDVEKIHLAAGRRFYGHLEDQSVVAVTMPDDQADDLEAAVEWRSPISGTVSSMLAGDDRLFAVTEEGWIYCFGGDQTGAAVPDLAAAEPAHEETLVFVRRGGSWRCLADGAKPPDDWRRPQFNDRDWPAIRVDLDDDKPPKPLDEKSPLRKIDAIYYRSVFEFNGQAKLDELRLSIFADDGTRVYLNGAEVATLNSYAGDPKPRPDAKRRRDAHLLRLDAALLKPGKNVLALEVPLPVWETDEMFIAELLGELPAAAPQSAVAAPKQWESAAGEIVNHSGATAGYCVVAGAGDRELVEELARYTRLHVVAIDPDEDRVAALRSSLDERKLLGGHAAVHAGDLESFGLPPYLASLIVVDDQDLAVRACREPVLTKLLEALRPYGGAACLRLAEEQEAALRAAKAISQSGDYEVQRCGDHVLVRRGALRGAGQWTHQNADAGNTLVSRDTLVRLPLGVLWFGGPSNQKILPRHGHGPVPQVVDGRLIIEGPDVLRAIDIYTGRLLWQRRLPDIGLFYDNTGHHPGAGAIGGNYVTLSDAIYVAYGRAGLKLDPATGEIVDEFRLPPHKDQGLIDAQEERPLDLPQRESPYWGFIAVHEDLLIAGSSPLSPLSTSRHKPDLTGLEARYGESSRRLVVLDRHSGKVLWQRDARESFRHNGIVAGTPKNSQSPVVFCLDKITDLQLAALKRRGASLENHPDSLLALDARTGEVLWQAQENVTGTWLSYSAEHDVLLQAGSKNRDRAADETSRGMVAYRGASGEVLWSHDKSYTGPCLILDRQIITQGEAYDLFTGEPVERAHPLTGERLNWTYARNYGCNSAIGCPNLLTFRSAAAGFLDLTGEAAGTGNFGGFRSSCTNNLVPAGGVLNVPEYTRTCICAYQNQTSLALVHMPQVECWTFSTLRWTGNPVKRLGVNFGAPGDRHTAAGALWVEYPSVGGKSPDPPISIKWREDDVDADGSPASSGLPSSDAGRSLLELSTRPTRFFRLHQSQIEPHELAFVAASGLRGEAELEISLASDRHKEPRNYTVRLIFCEVEDAKAGERRFDVFLQGARVLENWDIAAAAVRPRRTVVKEFPNIAVGEKLKITLRSAPDSKAPPMLCGVEVAAQ